MKQIATMKIWNVEQGLAIHVEAPNGKYIVIDLGSTQSFSPLTMLKGKDVGYMVITHPHLDHFSDINNIDYARPKVLWRCQSYNREELLKKARQEDKDKIIAYCNFTDLYTGGISRIQDPASGLPFAGLTAKVFYTTECDKSNINNFSAIVVLQLCDSKIVVCGDNEICSLDHLMNNNGFKNTVKNSSVLVAPHHGRESGYHKEFVELVNPEITIISDKYNVVSTASSIYSEKSRGCYVYDKKTNTRELRKSLSTRKDGNIEIQFGETIFFNDYTCVTTNK